MKAFFAHLFLVSVRLFRRHFTSGVLLSHMEKGGALTALGEFMIFASYDEEVKSFFFISLLENSKHRLSHMKLLSFVLAIGKL